MSKRTASCDITRPKGHPTTTTNQIESLEVIAFTQGILFPVLTLNGEELLRNYTVAVL